MLYLISEMAVALSIAAFLGVALGWLSGRAIASRLHVAQRSDHEAQIAMLEEDRAELRTHAASLQRDRAELSHQLIDLRGNEDSPDEDNPRSPRWRA